MFVSTIEHYKMQRDALVTIIGDGDIVIDFEDTGHHSTGRAVRGRPYR